MIQLADWNLNIREEGTVNTSDNDYDNDTDSDDLIDLCDDGYDNDTDSNCNDLTDSNCNDLIDLCEHLLLSLHAGLA